MLFLLMLACATTTTMQQAPPPAEPSLYVGSLHEGQRLGVEVWNAEPNAPVQVYATRLESGPPPCAGSVCLQIPEEVELLSGTTDADGRLVWTGPRVPVGPADVWRFQLLQTATPARSNIVTRRYGGRCEPDAWEPNDNRADAVPVNGLVQGVRGCHDDEDWFVVTVPDGHWLRVEPRDPGRLERAPTNSDPLRTSLYIGHDPDPLYNRSTWENTTGEDVDVHLLVGATGWHDEQPYDLLVQTTPPGRCTSQDTNLSHSSADPLRRRRYVRQRVCAGESRWFDIEVQQAGRLTVLVDLPPDNAWVTMRLIDPAGVVRDMENHEDLSALATMVGTWKLWVESSQRTINDGIEFGVEAYMFADGRCVFDPFEPNDVSTMPTTAAASMRATVCPGDTDWYAVSLAADELLRYRLSATNLRANLRDANGGYLSRGAVGNWGYFTPSSAGLYLLEVLPSLSGVPEAMPGVIYTLETETSLPEPCVEDAHEPYAVSLGDGDAVALSVCPGDRDDVEIALQVGQIALVSVQALNDTRDELPRPVLSGLGGRTTTLRSNIRIHELQFRADVAGDLVVRLDNRGREGVDALVAVELVDTQLASDAFGVHNSAGTAAAIAPGSYAAAVDEGAEDWFRVDGLESNLVVRVEPVDPLEQLSVLVFDAAGVEIPNVVRGVLPTDFYWDAPATVYVRVQGERDASNDAIPYTMDIESFSPPMCPLDMHEPNDGSGVTTSIDAGDTVIGVVCQDDRDVFTIDVPANHEAHWAFRGGDDPDRVLELRVYKDGGLRSRTFAGESGFEPAYSAASFRFRVDLNLYDPLGGGEPYELDVWTVPF